MEQKNGVASSHFGYKTCLGDAEFLFILCFIAYCCIQISFYLKKKFTTYFFVVDENGVD